MGVDLNLIKQELAGIRHRARSIEGSLKELALVDMARQIVASADKISRSIEDLEREQRKARRAAEDRE